MTKTSPTTTSETDPAAAPAVEKKPDRFTRQAGLVPQDILATVRATVIGVGAIGRQVAIQLAAIGVQDLQIIDFDEVDLSNTTTQGFLAEEIGQNKVEAVKSMLTRIDPNIRVEAVMDRYRPSFQLGAAVFCCVDSIEVRSAIWETAQTRCRFWTDGRMLGETMRILAAASPAERAHYGKTLFSAAEAQTGACTAKSTIYTASIAAGMMVHQFTRWLRDIPLDEDTSLSLLSGEMGPVTVSEPELAEV